MNVNRDISEILNKEENITIIGGSKYSCNSKLHNLTDNADNSYSCSSNSCDTKENLTKLRLDRDTVEESLIHEFGDSSFDDTSFLRDECLRIVKSIKRLIYYGKVLLAVLEEIEDSFANVRSCKESTTERESKDNINDCSSHSIFLSDDGQNAEKSEVSSLSQRWNSTREKFTCNWVNSFVSDYDSSDVDNERAFIDSVTEFDDDLSFGQDLTEDSFSSRCSSIVSSVECESTSSCSSIVFSEAVTEENYDRFPSRSTRGSLMHLEDDEVSSIEDVETLYSKTSVICSDWEDIVNVQSEFSQGFMNEGFIIEDNFEPPACSKHLLDVNEKWKINMAGVKDTPRDPVKISFASSSSLVVVHQYEKSEEEDQAYDFYALDKLRFQQRINDFNVLMSPFLTVDHRANVLLRNMYL